MNRRHRIAQASWLIAASTLPFRVNAATIFPLNKSRSEWKRLLPPDAYVVLFEEDTERAGSSPLTMKSELASSSVLPATSLCLTAHKSTTAALALAELLASTGRRRWLRDRLQADLPSHRVSLLALRRTSGPHLRRWPEADRKALLKQLHRPEVRQKGRPPAGATDMKVRHFSHSDEGQPMFLWSQYSHYSPPVIDTAQGIVSGDAQSWAGR